ncbi:MAG: tRNA glutamyl-Q(34) synthetase GluQRS [Succinivibrio sp.]|nr:tRNA glutamyl-Q(34) synthetase GluQRS [Succinivibrio sp.]
MKYTGRFAPTPSGRLHFGSLVTALGAYLRARSLNGRFLLRIEDLDTPRCKSEYTASILRDLEILGFDYDEEVKIQSANTKTYEEAIGQLLASHQAFYCTCTRKSLKDHPCRCQHRFVRPDLRYSVRFCPSFTVDCCFEDILSGHVLTGKSTDYLQLKRSDGLIAYNLACVVDDHLDHITEVVRGSDLIAITPQQNALYRALGFAAPDYLHLPLVLNAQGNKLSKQNHATPVLEEMSPLDALLKALRFLGQDTTVFAERDFCCAQVLKLAAAHFDLQRIPVENRKPADQVYEKTAVRCGQK